MNARKRLAHGNKFVGAKICNNSSKCRCALPGMVAWILSLSTVFTFFLVWDYFTSK